MANPDISRAKDGWAKGYRRSEMQQGRVLTDADWNDHVGLVAEEQRLDRVDIIGPVGTSDGGFRISDPTVTGGRLTFEISAGSYFAGGLRASLASPQAFDAQTDWLDQEPPLPPTADRHDLVYAEIFEVDVSAVEDGELREVALGGPDTSTRARVMCRVRLAEGVGFPDCSRAWTVLRDRWATAHVGTVSDAAELVANADLTIGFGPGGDPGDLCSPTVAGGYLDQENRLIRVEVRSPTTFSWGFHNNAPLYRIERVDATTFTMLTPPKDHAHWPLSGQVVEILPWAAVLANGEKLAASQGYMDRVDASFDPDTGRFTIHNPLPSGFGANWQSRPDAAALGDPYFYFQVCDRGPDHTSPPEIPFLPWTSVPLGTTGLTATLHGPDLNAGDHWLVAARPETPNRVVPWNLENLQGRPLHGVRRFVAPLAVLEWTVSGSSVTGKVVSDCRETFRPLTRLKGCCTFTVGDGRQSHGDFASVQQALDNLPPAGGQVCLLPGEFEELVTVKGRVDVTITGCGRRSRLVAPGGDFENAAIRIEDSTGITVRSLAIEAMTATGIRAVRSYGLTFEDLHLLARDRSAIYATDGFDVRVIGNLVEVEPLAGGVSTGSDAGLWPAVYVAAESVLVKANTVRMRSQASLQKAALGGIQIGGASSMVTIACNVIEGGLGNGITLGSVRYIPASAWAGLATNYTAVFQQALVLPPGAGFGIDDQGCLTSPTGFTPTDQEGQPLVPISEGDVSQVRIVDNLIRAMGANGIGVARFFLQSEPGFITADRLTIDDNRIYGCLRLSTPTLPPAALATAGFGGIALANCIDLVVRDNLISGNGASHVDPVSGLYVVRVTPAFITGNRILDNGPITSNEPPRPGDRAGIYLGMALAGTSTGTASPVPGLAGAATPGPFAAWVHGNVVNQPVGRALAIRAIGSVLVENNLFSTERAARVENPPAPPGGLTFFLNAATVWIINLGVSPELYARASSFAGISLTDFLSPVAGSTMSARLLAGGAIQFNDNRVHLGSARTSNTNCSMYLTTRDDLSVQANQSQCSEQVLSIPWNTIAAAWSLRVVGNRFTEPMAAAVLSALSFGVMNTTTDNQSTHCLYIVGHPALLVDQPNVALANLSAGGCAKVAQDGRALGISWFTPS